MRVIVDYGLIRPPLGPSAGRLADTGAAASDTSKQATRRESVLVVDFAPEDGRRGGNEALGPAAAAGRGEAAAAGAGGIGDDGIPIPGTPYELTTSEEAGARDRAVRSHEEAHLLALGPYAASGVTLSTRRGPDGRQYAVGGSIQADLSEVPGDPQATLRKANAVRRAALAPGSPSSADMQVAARAYRLAQDAREELEARRLDRSS